MKEEIRYRWRIKWVNKWTTTSHHATWEQISNEHPEATALEHTREVLLVPETAEELRQRMDDTCTSGYLKNHKCVR
ncbi:MAG: hypothetical protein HXX19_19230 [Rhodoferax sp.]|nr:hypothetical protein [Rhodoferax sp.]